MIPLFIKSLTPKPTPTVEVTKPAKPKKEPTAAEPDTSHIAGLLAILKDHKPETKFGPGSVEPGHAVSFKAGSFVGSGKCTAAGKHGVTVEDDDARSHQIHWHEVTGSKKADAKK